jgi:hypothetical protein
MPPNLDLDFLFAGVGSIGGSTGGGPDAVGGLLPLETPLLDPPLGNSGVEPCFFIECKDLSFELARLLALGFSPASGMLVSEACNLWDDFEAIRFEKKPFEASRLCFGD